MVQCLIPVDTLPVYNKHSSNLMQSWTSPRQLKPSCRRIFMNLRSLLGSDRRSSQRTKISQDKPFPLQLHSHSLTIGTVDRGAPCGRWMGISPFERHHSQAVIGCFLLAWGRPIRLLCTVPAHPVGELRNVLNCCAKACFARVDDVPFLVCTAGSNDTEVGVRHFCAGRCRN